MKLYTYYRKGKKHNYRRKKKNTQKQEIAKKINAQYVRKFVANATKKERLASLAQE